MHSRGSPFGVKRAPGVALVVALGVSVMADKRPPARIWRCGKNWYMPGRESESERQRDQELLDQIPNVSRAQVQRDLDDIKKQRKAERDSRASDDLGLTSSAQKRRGSDDSRPGSFARCKRNGRDIYMADVCAMSGPAFEVFQGQPTIRDMDSEFVCDETA